MDVPAPTESPRQTTSLGRPEFPLATLVVLLLLVGLPIAAWLDLRALTQHSLETQATEVGRQIDEFRAYYSANVVGHLDDKFPAKAVHNFREVPGSIPIPATLSLELGDLLSRKDGALRYRFISRFPFKGRNPHLFDDFESRALDRLETKREDAVVEVAGGFGQQLVRRATPILMGDKCVACHNTHEDSPKKDWKVGDVRGMQEVQIRRPIETSLWSFKWLLSYFVCAVLVGVGFIARETRRQRLFRSLSAKLARYLSPQIFHSIFTGEMDVQVATTRKKLTIFFSDIVDFTATSERLQPEELTNLLNEYLTEMSAIAERHGGTIDKFIGDAIVVFFGDPATRGVREDAIQCLRMAIEMQRRLEALNAKWRSAGVEQPFRVRMGINTGYCNVGNFGSEDRVAYTIIGAEANLSSRLQAVCEPGGIVLSYETYVLVRDVVHARPLEPIQVKGVARTIVPYAVEGLVGEENLRRSVVTERVSGLDLFVDPEAVSDADAGRAVEALRRAADALEARFKGPSAGGARERPS